MATTRTIDGNKYYIPKSVKLKRIQVIPARGYVGFYDRKTHDRLPSLRPTKDVRVKAKASAFKGGYNYFTTGNLHKQVGKKYFVSLPEYKKLSKKYPEY